MTLKHLSLIFVSVILALSLSAGFSLWADPFGLYSEQTPDRLSRIDQFRVMRTYKPAQVTRKQPQWLVLGTSTAGRMQPGQSPHYPAHGFNLSMPGLTPMEALRLVQHSHNTQPLQRLVLALDFHTFLQTPVEYRFGFPLGRLITEPGMQISADYQMRMAQLRYRSLLSTRALSRSMLATARGWSEQPQSPTRATYYTDGSWERTALTQRSQRFARMKGNYGHRFIEQHGGEALHLDQLVPLLRFCHLQNIETVIIVNPLHLEQLDNAHQVGLYPQLEAFHRSLITLNRTVAEQVNRSPYEVLGFNLNRAAISEPASAEQLTEAPWFEDGMHYSSRFARLMLSTALAQSSQRSANAGSRILTEATIEAYLQTLSEQLTVFQHGRKAMQSDPG